MNIAIAGLGLIGGSLAKAAKANTRHTVLAYDLDAASLSAAIASGAVDEVLDEENLGRCDFLIVALYPKAAVGYIERHAHSLKPGAVVVDCCGVKRYVSRALRGALAQHKFVFIGGHPMAGAERSGFAASTAALFANAPMILAPEPDTDEQKLEETKALFLALGFASIKLTTPEEHDRVVAYTSQLAHVLSSAYILSPQSLEHRGFSAGSFRDLTRVAYLNEEMWTELFLANADELAGQIDSLCERLSMYSQAIRTQDEAALKALLIAGRERKTLCSGEKR